MAKLIAIIQMLTGAILALLTVATVVNVVLIVSNQENSISVVNTMIGQGVLIIFLAAMSRILIGKGLRGWRTGGAAQASPNEDLENTD